MEERPRLSNIRERFRLSEVLSGLLERCQPFVASDEIDVGAFLYAAAKAGQDDRRSAQWLAYTLFGEAFEKGQGLNLTITMADRPMENWLVSAGLLQAFQDARQIRKRTGGQDDFLGTRHVLFAIITGVQPPLVGEMILLSQQIQFDRRRGAHAAAAYLVEYAEPQEDREEWERIFEERDLPIPGESSPSPKGPRPVPARSAKKRTPKPPEPPLDPVAPGVALNQPDDPWGAGVQDRAGARQEAAAFAAMVTARSFTPPLAVGIFGDWGSGKSFFMRLVDEEVKKITLEAERTGKVPSAVASDTGISFFPHVVPIRFNAWHYVETNLWASLVDHIFTTLDRWTEKEGAESSDRMFEKLSTARQLTVDSAEALIQRRRDLRDATRDKERLEADLAFARAQAERSPATVIAAAWNMIGGSRANRDRMRSLAGAGGDTVAQGLTDLQLAARALNNESTCNAVRWGSIWHALTRPLSLIMLVGAGLALALLGRLVLPWLTSDPGYGAQVLAFVSSFLAPLGIALAWTARKANAAISAMRSFGGSFGEAVTEGTEAEARKLAASIADVAAAESRTVEADERFRLARERVAEASRDYHAQTGRGRVLQFVRDRVAKGEYAKQLGFIATVRKDFEELSALMAAPEVPTSIEAEAARAAHKLRVDNIISDAKGLLDADEQQKLLATTIASAPVERTFDRIILYIDDLDRCPTDKVVAVLQSIHLLLAFRLFVVFVAVDVRWLRHALESEYAGQMKSRLPGATQANDAPSMASPGDYLEKIFQIPYWVRPMATASTLEILQDHMGEEESAVEAIVAKPTRAEKARKTDGAADPQPSASQSTKGDSTEASPKGASLAKLRLTAPERAFIRKIGASLDGSPRRTLRFINVYRVIKASLPGIEVARLERSEHRALLTLLSISIAADGIYPAIARTLREDKLQGKWVDRILAGAGGDSAECKLAAAAFEAMRPTRLDIPSLRHFSTLVERFSFQPSLPNASPVASAAP